MASFTRFESVAIFKFSFPSTIFDIVTRGIGFRELVFERRIGFCYVFYIFLRPPESWATSLPTSGVQLALLPQPEN